MKSILYLENENTDTNTNFTFRYAYSKSEPFRLHHHDYYELFITVSGEVIHSVNNVTSTLPEGSLVFIRPQDSHLYIRQFDREYSFANLAFSKEIFKELFNYIDDCTDIKSLIECKSPPTVKLSLARKNALLDSLNRLNTMHENNPTGKKLLLKQVLFDIFTNYHTVENSAKKEIPFWLENAIEEFKKPENVTGGMDRFRELCGKSNEHICRTVKSCFDVSASEVINDIQLCHVANLLISTNKSITDLCYESGFNNVGWFNTIFKKKYNLSPREFRKQHII